MSGRHHDWLSQAENDYEWARDSLKNGYVAQTCFIAQQICEKSLKAIGYYRGADLIKGHSCNQIAEELLINGELREELKD